ncbi:hypothetical protein [Leptolyngbya sp. 7M]|uniref:hypothetical protein n=1 Tax=Leptolyngbya sp. 7M TaxID=2812896 RepID=UPI001B8AFB59|nr:hypothetical protein [Leptolyngbya sp. 7M]QYO62705.1 hypothetical protein JVX88_22080 [Leptolyngbya sp. 7M]
MFVNPATVLPKSDPNINQRMALNYSNDSIHYALNVTNNLTGIATIKSFTAEAYERNQVQSESDAYCLVKRSLCLPLFSP